jgi:WD40 repeat protein
LIATGHGGDSEPDITANIWDATSGESLLLLRGHIPYGNALATWDPNRYEALGSPSIGGDVTDVSFSPDGLKVVTTGSDGTIRIWQPTSGDLLLVIRASEAEVTSARFSPDGKLVVGTSVDTTARLWDVDSGRLVAVLQGHRGFVNDAVFSPDGSLLLTASHDGTVRVWQLPG